MSFLSQTDVASFLGNFFKNWVTFLFYPLVTLVPSKPSAKFNLLLRINQNHLDCLLMLKMIRQLDNSFKGQLPTYLYDVLTYLSNILNGLFRKIIILCGNRFK